MTEYKSHSHELKIEAVKAVFEEKLTKPEAIEVYGIKSISSLESWYRLYREEGLEARVHELELENEILKRLNALAEKVKQKRRTR